MKAHDQIERQWQKRDERIAKLAEYGIKATCVDMNSVRIGAADLEKILRALKQNKAVQP